MTITMDQVDNVSELLTQLKNNYLDGRNGEAMTNLNTVCAVTNRWPDNSAEVVRLRASLTSMHASAGRGDTSAAERLFDEACSLVGEIRELVGNGQVAEAKPSVDVEALKALLRKLNLAQSTLATAIEQGRRNELSTAVSNADAVSAILRESVEVVTGLIGEAEPFDPVKVVETLRRNSAYDSGDWGPTWDRLAAWIDERA